MDCIHAKTYHTRIHVNLTPDQTCKKSKPDIKHPQTKVVVCHSISPFWNLKNTTTPKVLICYDKQTGAQATNKFSPDVSGLCQSFHWPPCMVHPLQVCQAFQLSKFLLSNLAVQTNADMKVVSHLYPANCFTNVHL